MFLQIAAKVTDRGEAISTLHDVIERLNKGYSLGDYWQLADEQGRPDANEALDPHKPEDPTPPETPQNASGGTETTIPTISPSSTGTGTTVEITHTGGATGSGMSFSTTGDSTQDNPNKQQDREG